MKLLLDENLPRRLKHDFSDFDIFTVAEMGWAGTTNEALLRLMIDNDFSALLTFDKNLQHQQNFRKYSLTVFVLSAPNNTYAMMQRLVPQVKSLLLLPLVPGPVEVKADGL